MSLRLLSNVVYSFVTSFVLTFWHYILRHPRLRLCSGIRDKHLEFGEGRSSATLNLKGIRIAQATLKSVKLRLLTETDLKQCILIIWKTRYIYEQTVMSLNSAINPAIIWKPSTLILINDTLQGVESSWVCYDQ